MPQSGSVGPQTKPGTFRIASTTESSDIGQPLNDPKRIGEQWPPGEFSQCVTASVPGNLMQKDEAELLDQRQERKKKLNEARENALDLERSPSPSSPSTRSMWLGEGRKRRRTQEMDGEAAQKMGEARSEYEAERGQEEAQLLFQRTETERRPDELRGPASLTGAKSGAITYHNLLTLISSIPESRINNGTVLNAYHQSMFAEDSLSAVVNSHYWRRTLLKLIADLDIPEDVALRNALREDEERLAKNIVAILYSDSEQKAVLNLKGNSAQNFLDVLQDILDKGLLLQKEHNSKARRMIIKLSQACDKLPSSLFISGVAKRDEHASFFGGFGDIYQAFHHEKRVALKRIRTFHRDAEQRHMRLQLCREALVWQRLQHPFILPFIGIDREAFPGSLCMVSPWMENGTVLKHLKDYGKASVDRLLLETTQGLHYLHSHGMVHGDLRGANILITHEWSACLADFGLVSFSDATAATHTSQHRAGSLRWMAPELMAPERFGHQFVRTPATDVYAFGCVCLELYTGRPPFSSLSETATLLKVIEGGRPEQPTGEETMPTALWDLVSECWRETPAERPLTATVVRALALKPDFLATQDLSKGHSGSGSCGAENDLPNDILGLDEESTPALPSLSRVSPPTPTLSLFPSESPRPLQHNFAIRELRATIDVDPYAVQNLQNPLRGTSQFGRGGEARRKLPGIQSSFSATYHMTGYDDDDDDMMADLPYRRHSPLYPGGASDELVSYYVGKAVNLQYPLADAAHIRRIMAPLLIIPSATREAARLLASVHVQRSAYQSNSFTALQDTKTRQQYGGLLQMLSRSLYTEDDAFAAISIITSFLFDGGAGDWQAWLTVPCDYVHSVFRNRDPRGTFEICGETTRFIIKATIWFDVLAAVTTQEAPRLLEYIRKLFSPLESSVSDPALLPSPELSMMSIMGCENLVLWVLAEASALSVWERKQRERGCLSVQELIKRAANLEAYLDTARASHLAYNPTLTLTEARALSADIFRRATRVYLRSIMLGNYPNVREIVESVDEAIALLRQPQIPSSVVRSTMFAFFVCGALTHDKRHQHEVASKLDLEEEEPAESVVGSSLSIKKLLETIWSERLKSSPGRPVEWRKVLRQSRMLLA